VSNIPMLPVVVKPMKDAARAAKVNVRWAMHRIKEITVTYLLDLPQFIVTGYWLERRGEQEIVHVCCMHREEVAICPRCQQVSTTYHDGKNRCVRDLDVWGKCTFLHFTRRRFDCERCGRPFTEKLACIDRQRRQTRRFEQHIYRRCLTSSCKAVAQGAWLNEATAKAIFKRWAKRTMRWQGAPRVRVLGIDEIALKKRHKQYALVLSDLERHCVIAVLPERSKERLERWFADLSTAERKAIRVVSIDMWEPYRQAVQAILPHAQLVADRFHVMKQLNDRLTQMRRSIQRQADEATRQVLKGSRWLLVNNRNQLTPEHETRLQQVLAASPQLRTVYLLKEEFRTICEKSQDRRQAERFLRAWLWKAEHTADRFLLKFVNTLRNWWHEILNYFEDRVTNGFVEGINRAIRAIINRACGYRNFENFQLQIMAQHGPPPVPLPHQSA
jgi:transposase